MLGLKVLLGIFSDLGVFLCVTHLKVAIENQKCGGYQDEQEGEQEVLDEK